MRKRGGAGTLRKKCVERICAAPVSSDARPPRVTPTPPRPSPPPNAPLPDFGHESQPELLEVWNEQQRLRNCVPPRWAPAGERVKAGLQPYPPITVAAARAARGRAAGEPGPTAPEPDADDDAPAPEPVADGAAPAPEPEDDTALRATETPFRAALAAHAASVNLVATGDTVAGFAPPTDAMLAAATGACAAALPDGDCEDLSSVRLAKEYYDHWKPAEVRAIVLAESHVFTAPEEQAAKRLSDAAFERLQREHGYDGPRGYVRLVNCLGYGEQALCADGRAADRGSTQFWQLLAACSRELAPATPATPVVGPGGQLSDVLKLGSPRLADRLAAKFRVMRELKARGIWLLDTCVVGWYIPQATYYVRSARTGEVQRKAKERPPKRCKTPALALSWELYTKHVVRAAAAAGHLRALIPIGAEVFAAVGLDRLRAAAPGAVVPGEAFPAPNAWVRGGYGPYYAYLSAICAPGADVANVPLPRPQTTGRAAPAAPPAAAPSAVVTPGKVPKPRGRAPLGATWDGARGEWVRGATLPPAPVVEAAPAAADDEELTERSATSGTTGAVAFAKARARARWLARASSRRSAARRSPLWSGAPCRNRIEPRCTRLASRQSSGPGKRCPTSRGCS